MRKTLISSFIRFCALCLVSPTLSLAQDVSSPSQPLRMDAAVELAERNYPAIRTAQSQVAAASAGIDLARTAYLPRVDLLWQQNRATTNNIFGALLPQGIIPPISGPALGTKSLTSVFGSAGGVLLSWEPFDFGARKANVDVARAQARQASAGVEVTRLDVATSASDAFLGLLAAQEAVRTAESNVSRAQTFADAVHVLVKQGLRAGADAARADSELSVAKTQLIRTQQTTEVSRATLAEALGLPGTVITVNPGPLLDLPPDTTVAIPDFRSHPQAVAQNAAIETVRSRERVLDRSYFPRFNLQSAFNGRGTGALTSGGSEGGLHGLLPETPNYALGFSVSFPAFDIFAIRARRRIEQGYEAVERGRYEETIQSLRGQYARAQAFVDGALRIAQETPNELKAAQETEALVLGRFKYGLATVTDVADAQRLLAQAEIDNAVARLNVWRALLAAARVQGDLKPFLQRVKY